MNQEKIGKFIFSLRKKAGLTQEELGEKLCVTGKAVSRWENGLSLPDIFVINNFCKLFNITNDEFFSAKKKEKNTIKKLVINLFLSLIIFFVIYLFFVNCLNRYYDFHIYIVRSESSLFSVEGIIHINAKNKFLILSNLQYLGDDLSNIVKIKYFFKINDTIIFEKEVTDNIFIKNESVIFEYDSSDIDHDFCNNLFLEVYYVTSDKVLHHQDINLAISQFNYSDSITNR